MKIYQLVGFKYGVTGVALLVLALVFFVAADTPYVQSSYNSSSSLIPVTSDLKLVTINTTPSTGLVKLRLWLVEGGGEGVIDVYYFRSRGEREPVYVASLELSHAERYLEVYTPPTSLIGFVCRDCVGNTTIGYNYTLYTVSKPYFVFLWPGVAAMILGIVLGILGLVYVSLEAKIIASSGKGK